MYALIDCTNYKAIATHESEKALCALAFIQYANVDVVIMPCNENRPWAQFNEAQMESIFNGVVDSATTAFKTTSYTDSIHKCREMVTAAPHLRLPISEANLIAQAERIPENSTKPFKITAGNTPQQLDRWHVDPQRDRSRYAQPTAIQLTRNTGAPAAPDVSGTMDSTGAPKPKRAPSVKRAKGSNRPAPGSTTGKVWGIADAQLAAGKPYSERDPKAFRKQVIDECKANGINPSTASVQFGAWLAACSK